MATEDISRNATSFAKRYDGVRLQQGRVTTDDDFNEGARLDAERRGSPSSTSIGPTGSPDDGFAISNPRINTHGDLISTSPPARCTWAACASAAPARPTRSSPTGSSSRPPTARRRPTARADLAYVMAWEQPVEAVEDCELFETALGGPDTSTRVRLMWRIVLGAGVGGADCATAWTRCAAGDRSDLGTWDPTRCLCERDAKLQVTFDHRQARRPVLAVGGRRLSRRREPGDPRAARRRHTPSPGASTTPRRSTASRSAPTARPSPCRPSPRTRRTGRYPARPSRSSPGRRCCRTARSSPRSPAI